MTGQDQPAGEAGELTTALTEAQREQALARFALLRPHVEDGAALADVARQAGVPLRTAQRWL